MTTDLHFEEIKESRGAYYVRYRPPIADHKVATLSVVFPKGFYAADVMRCMSDELRHWLQRYPVPLMIWAWDEKEDMIRQDGTAGSCLVGWRDPDTGEVRSSWKIDELSSFLDRSPTPDDWRTIYIGVPFKTNDQAKENGRRKIGLLIKQARLLKLMFVLWLAVIPAAIAVVEFLGPQWLGTMVLGYSLWKAYRAGWKILTTGEMSKNEKANAEKQRRMNHYFYHCERNPDGFVRLKRENFEKDAVERTLKEAAEIVQR